jgi:hypothetical protein
MFLGNINLSVCFDAAQDGNADDGNYRFRSYQVSMLPDMAVQNVTVA